MPGQGILKGIGILSEMPGQGIQKGIGKFSTNAWTRNPERNRQVGPGHLGGCSGGWKMDVLGTTLFGGVDLRFQVEVYPGGNYYDIQSMFFLRVF